MRGIVHCKKDPYDTYIGRPSKFGNPWVIGKDGTRAEVIAKYAAWIRTQPQLLASLSELEGKTLGCWCDYPSQDCHGRILLELLEERKKTLDVSTNKVLAVIGSRTFRDYGFLKRKLLLHDPARVVSGGAGGADSLAQEFCREHGVSILIFYPKWDLGKSAGFIRNTQIVEACEELVAFDMGTNGTADSVRKAREAGKKVYVYRIGE